MNAYDHEPKSTGKYLKINSGEVATVRIVGEPLIFIREYKGDKNERAGFRVLLKTEDGWVPKALEASVPIFNGIKALAKDEDWGDPEEYSIKISRKGEKLETKWSILPGKKVPLTSEQRDLIEELGDIEELFDGDDVVEVLYRPGQSDDHPASVGAGKGKANRPRDPEPEAGAAPEADPQEYDPFQDD